MIYKINQFSQIERENMNFASMMEKRQNAEIDFDIQGMIYAFLIPGIIDSFSKKGNISVKSLKIDNQNMNIFYEKIRSGDNIEIRKPTVIFSSLPENITLNIYSTLICFSVISGKVILKNENSMLLSNQLKNSTIINDSGIFRNISSRRKIYKYSDIVY